jgi:signal transduction histidine kinase
LSTTPADPDAGWEVLQSSPTRPVRAVMRWVRALDARYPFVWDLAPVFLVALIVWNETRAGYWREQVQLDGGVPSVVPWIQAVSFTLPLLWRRRYPFATLMAMGAPMAIAIWSGLMSGTAFCVYVSLFSVALRSSMTRLALSGGLVVLGTAAWVGRWPPEHLDRAFVASLIQASVFVLAGFVIRIRRDYVVALIDRAARLEIERDQREQLAAAAERARIAREMHDIIGHNLAVITGLADGGSYAARKTPERAAQALDAIGATSRQALGELRRLLEVMRHEPVVSAELAPQPGLAELDRLLARVREAGLPVRYTVTGAPGGGLSAGEQLTVYRVVQEALTNTLRHGGPKARAELRVDHAAEGTEVTVSDDGRGVGGAGQAGGQGINGMRERAAVYDGTLEAGPRSGGGWQVRLRLPARGPA